MNEELDLKLVEILVVAGIVTDLYYKVSDAQMIESAEQLCELGLLEKVMATFVDTQHYRITPAGKRAYEKIVENYAGVSTSSEIQYKKKSSSDEMRKQIAGILNFWGWDTLTNTPDFLLAEMLVNFLEAYKSTVDRNNKWHSKMLIKDEKFVVDEG